MKGCRPQKNGSPHAKLVNVTPDAYYITLTLAHTVIWPRELTVSGYGDRPTGVNRGVKRKIPPLSLLLTGSKIRFIGPDLALRLARSCPVQSRDNSPQSMGVMIDIALLGFCTLNLM